MNDYASHVEEAEGLAGPHGDWYYTEYERVPAILARAQVHATLALAAALAAVANGTRVVTSDE